MRRQASTTQSASSRISITDRLRNQRIRCGKVLRDCDIRGALARFGEQNRPMLTKNPMIFNLSRP